MQVKAVLIFQYVWWFCGETVSNTLGVFACFEELETFCELRTLQNFWPPQGAALPGTWQQKHVAQRLKKKIRVSGYHVPLEKGTILRGEESSLLQDMSVFRGVGSFWGSNYFWTKHLESTRSMSIFTEFDLESTCNDRRGLADFTHEWKNYRKSQRKTSNTIGTSSSFWEVSLPTQLPNTNIVLTTPSLWTTQKKH